MRPNEGARASSADSSHGCRKRQGAANCLLPDTDRGHVRDLTKAEFNDEGFPCWQHPASHQSSCLVVFLLGMCGILECAVRTKQHLDSIVRRFLPVKCP